MSEYDMIVEKLDHAQTEAERANACAAYINDVGNQLHSRQATQAQIAKLVRSGQIAEASSLMEIAASSCPSTSSIEAMRDQWADSIESLNMKLREVSEHFRKLAEREKARVAHGGSSVLSFEE